MADRRMVYVCSLAVRLPSSSWSPMLGRKMRPDETVRGRTMIPPSVHHPSACLITLLTSSFLTKYMRTAIAIGVILLWPCLASAEGGRGSRAKAGSCFIHRRRRSDLRPRLVDNRPSPEIRLLTRQQGTSHDAVPDSSSTCLDCVEDAIKAATTRYGLRQHDKSSILLHEQSDRETIGVVTNLSKRLAGLARNNDCRRCWMQRKHCICDRCPPLGHIPSVRRLFLLTHHKEIGMIVDTAKLIMASFPTTRLVVSGIKHEFQPTLVEMTEVLEQSTLGNERCLVLFPAEDALTFEEIVADMQSIRSPRQLEDEPWNVIVIDGTWSQVGAAVDFELLSNSLTFECRNRNFQGSQNVFQILGKLQWRQSIQSSAIVQCGCGIRSG